jgi:SAM-dependent methyltransferase
MKTYTVKWWKFLFGNGFKERAQEGFDQIKDCLSGQHKLIDIGSGFGHVTSLLQEKGYEVTSVDAKKHYTVAGVETLIYDGKTLPFADNSFDSALLMTVMHHANDPLALLDEALRVAKRVIIIEDLVSSNYSRWRTHVLDRILNFDFINPIQNLSDEGWKRAFADRGLRLVKTDYWRTNVFWSHIDQAHYCVDRLDG